MATRPVKRAAKAAPTKRPAAKRTSAAAKHSNRPRHIHSVSQGTSHINMMLYGPPGAGKSHLVGTRPKMLVLANNANETVSMQNTGVTDVDRWVVQDINDLTEAYEYIRHDGVKDYEWIAFDNATLFQDQNMDYIMETLVATKSHRNRYQPDRAEYGQNQQMIGLFIRNMVAEPVNFVMTCHVMQKEDPLTERETYLPLLQGGQGDFAQKVCGWMNIVGYLDVRKKGENYNRVLYFQKSGKVYAKDRYGALGPRMTDPTIPKIEALIKKRKAS